MSLTQGDKAARFRALHQGPGAFVIPNPWDAGSARVLAGLGFTALATSSGASAGILGRRDGKVTPRGGARARAGHRRGDRPAGLGRPREGIRRHARRRGRDHPAGRGGGAGRGLDRGRHRRPGPAPLRHRPGHGARGGGRAGGAGPPVPVHADRAGGELPARQPEPGRHDRAAPRLRAGGRGRALRPGPPGSGGGASGLRRGVEAGQLHGRDQGQVVHRRRARGGRA